MSKFKRLSWAVSVLASLMLLPVTAMAEDPSAAVATAEAEVRQAIRDYDEALRKADTATVEKIWATEYTFINPQGKLLSRSERVANLGTGRTALNQLAHVPQDERIHVYGDIALYSTLLTLRGQYSGEAEQGQFRAIAVWIRRDGRWQLLSTQMTPVVAP